MLVIKTVHYLTYFKLFVLVGQCNENNCRAHPGEYRNFFYFDIPELNEPIESAFLTIPTRGVYLDQSPTVIYQLTSLDIDREDLAPISFPDLGFGIFYGSREYTADDAQTIQTIPLSSEALTAIGSGGFVFALSGRVVSPTDFAFDAPDQAIFGYSQNRITQLTITTVPLPAALPMMLFGLSGIGFIGFKSKQDKGLETA